MAKSTRRYPQRWSRSYCGSSLIIRTRPLRSISTRPVARSQQVISAQPLRSGHELTDLCAGLAIYDTMTYIRSPVSTVCVGQAASMGSLLLCAGERGQRFCLPHSSIMIHQPSGGYFGQASDIAIHATEILRVRKSLNQIYKDHLTKPHTLDEIERMMERDRFLSATEALEMGIVDQILDRRVKEERKKDI